MANLLEFLMHNDVAADTKVTKDYEIKRLSEKMGEPFILHLRSLTNKETDMIPFDKRGQVDMGKMRHILIGYGVTNTELNDVALLKQYNVATKAGLLDNILLPGETAELMKEIQSLSGIATKEQQEADAETVDAVKN